LGKLRRGAIMDVLEEHSKMMLGFMGSTAPQASAAGGERRGGDRFPIEREVTFKVLNSKIGAEPGSGRTLNISSTGVLFSTDENLTPGKRVELSISWPIQLNGKCGLKLVARGRVVRARAKSIAVEIDKYEFRTVGATGLKPLQEMKNRVSPF